MRKTEYALTVEPDLSAFVRVAIWPIGAEREPDASRLAPAGSWPIFSALVADAVSMQLFTPSSAANATIGFLLEFPQALANLLSNRPATPLNDAQFGGYFFAQI
jgi:hypothetical protein